MTSAEKKTVVERAAGLSDEVLESVEPDGGPRSPRCASSLTPSMR